VSDVSDLTVPESAAGPDGLDPSDELHSHWQVIAGWPSDRPLYACYATATDQPELRAYIADFQRELGHLPGLDPIRPEWLHMTMQGIRFVDQVDQALIADLTGRLDEALAGIEPVPVVVERPIVTGDSTLMPVRPVAPVAAVRDEIRRVLHQAPEAADLFVLPGQDGAFDPHFSIAYANRAFPARDVSAALARCARDPLEITLRTVSMLTLIRREPRYHWVDERRIRLGR
jgi:hypothetical protein